MSAFKKLGKRLRDLSPAEIREIIAVAVILCISVALSIPQYRQDRENAKLQEEMRQNMELQEEIRQNARIKGETHQNTQ